MSKPDLMDRLRDHHRHFDQWQQEDGLLYNPLCRDALAEIMRLKRERDWHKEQHHKMTVFADSVQRERDRLRAAIERAIKEMPHSPTYALLALQGALTADEPAVAQAIKEVMQDYGEGRNEACLGDGVPCASDGQGGCIACDDGKGGYMTSKEPCAKTCIYRGGFVECECEPASRRYTDAMAALGEKQAEIERLREEVLRLQSDVVYIAGDRDRLRAALEEIKTSARKAFGISLPAGALSHMWVHQKCSEALRPADEPSPVQSDAGTAIQGLQNCICGHNHADHGYGYGKASYCRNCICHEWIPENGTGGT